MILINSYWIQNKVVFVHQTAYAKEVHRYMK